MKRKLSFIICIICILPSLSFADLNSSSVPGLEKDLKSLSEKPLDSVEVKESSIVKTRELEKKRMAEHRELLISRLGQLDRGE